MVIHDDDPFAPTEDDPTKRFRGRLASPVTIITSGSRDHGTGLTVSSLFVAEGDPALVYTVVGPNSDLFDRVTESGKFVIHICNAGHAGLADVFAGIRPNPGGLFEGMDVVASEWGPVLADIPNRAYCTTDVMEEVGWSGVLAGKIDRVEIEDFADPLLHFRGRYRNLRPVHPMGESGS